MPVRLVERLEPSPNYQQDIFRIDAVEGRDWLLSLVLQIPQRQAGDNKAASQKQRSTLSTFFWDTDVLPEKSGWQQASRLMAMRGLAYAVAETLENGFLAENRITVAPLIAAYISRDPYLSAVARGWSLGTWRDGSTENQGNWLELIASAYYRELFEFGVVATEDLASALATAGAEANDSVAS